MCITNLRSITTPVVSNFLETAFQLAITVNFCFAVNGSRGSVVGWFGVANLLSSQPMSSNDDVFLFFPEIKKNHQYTNPFLALASNYYTICPDQAFESPLYQAPLIFDSRRWWIDRCPTEMNPAEKRTSTLIKQLQPAASPSFHQITRVKAFHWIPVSKQDLRS